MDYELRGRRALVTGATRGIGRAIVSTFAKQGVNVGICARDQAAVKKTVAELAREGVTSWGESVDVSDSTALTNWIDAGARKLGGLDILVTNASALTSGGSPENFRQAFDTDLMQTVVAATTSLPHLEKSDAGVIIAISSVSGSEDYGYDEAAYSTIKSALNFYVKTLAREIAPKKIRANTVSPGNTYFDGGYWQKLETEQPEVFAKFLANNPFGRMAAVHDIANMVAFLASPAASFVSGANIVVDGSLTRRVQN